MMTKQQANELIAIKTNEAYELIRECEELAKKYGLVFSFDISYGMGGTFYGDPEQNYDNEAGWRASSHSC